MGKNKCRVSLAMTVMNVFLLIINFRVKDLMISELPAEQKADKLDTSQDVWGLYPDKSAEKLLYLYFLFLIFLLHYERLIFCTAVKDRGLMQFLFDSEPRWSHFKTFSFSVASLSQEDTGTGRKLNKISRSIMDLERISWTLGSCQHTEDNVTFPRK